VPDVPAVTMHNVDFAYDRRLVLRDASFTVRAGDFVGVVGPNGGGKTTLIRLILGLLTPVRGTVSVFGGSPAQARTRIGYVPQSWDCGPAIPVTVLDVVLMGLLEARWSGPYRAADRARALAALDQVDLADLADRPFCDLSGGEEQRALIARAIVSGPEMLVLDEPTASVDAAAEQDIYDLLHELHNDITIILVSHDIGLVAGAVESVLCVNQRVARHPTADLSDVTGEVLRELYGGRLRVVRHDQHVGEERGG